MMGTRKTFRHWVAVGVLLTAVLGSGGAVAIPLGTPVEFDSEEKQEQYSKLIRELRCTVCQSENLHESNAELAADMRRRVYEMTRDGASEDEVVDFLAQRYGDYIRYRPPFQANTVLLWGGPFIALAIGGAVWMGVVRRRRQLLEETTMSEEDLEALERFKRGE